MLAHRWRMALLTACASASFTQGQSATEPVILKATIEEGGASVHPGVLDLDYPSVVTCLYVHHNPESDKPVGCSAKMAGVGGKILEVGQSVTLTRGGKLMLTCVARALNPVECAVKIEKK